DRQLRASIDGAGLTAAKIGLEMTWRPLAAQPMHQVEDVPAMIDQDAAALMRVEAPLFDLTGTAGRSGTQPFKGQMRYLADPSGGDSLMGAAVDRRMFPVMHTHQHAARICGLAPELRQGCEIETERLFDQHMDALLQGRPDRRGVMDRRTRDIDEVEPLALEHQLEVVVHAHILEQLERKMAARADRV